MSLLDPQGQNPKERPAVVVSRDSEINENGEVWVVAISGSAGHAPGFEVPLQYASNGSCRTGLKKPCVAVCSWLVKVPMTSIAWNGRNHVPPLDMMQIAERVQMVMLAAGNDPGGSSG